MLWTVKRADNRGAMMTILQAGGVVIDTDRILLLVGCVSLRFDIIEQTDELNIWVLCHDDGVSFRPQGNVTVVERRIIVNDAAVIRTFLNGLYSQVPSVFGTLDRNIHDDLQMTNGNFHTKIILVI